MRADERRVRQVDEERQKIVNGYVGLELPAVLDDEPPALCERHDRLDAAGERARDDPRDLAIGKRPYELAGNDTPRLVQAPETVDAR